MGYKFLVFLAVALSLSFAKAQDAYYPDDSISAEASQNSSREFTGPTVLVIAGTQQGKCTPEMPMLKTSVAYQIQLQATANKTFVLDAKDFNLHLKAAPGKTVSQVITPNAAGNFAFICGDQGLPEANRTQGMFMVACPAGQHWDPSMKMCMPDQTPDDSSVDPATFQGVSRNIFSKNCTSCHAPQGADAPEAKIDFSSYATLTSSNQNPANPKHAPFIVPGDPDHSKLYLAVKNGKMPATEDGSPGVPLSAAHIQHIYDWIKAGALNN